MRFGLKCCLLLLICVILVTGCGGGGRKHRVSIVQYTMNTLDIPDESGLVFRINDSGQSVGYLYGYGTVTWDENGVMTRLVEPPGCQIAYMDYNGIQINSSGAIAGSGMVIQGGNGKRCVILWPPNDEPRLIRTTDYPDASNFTVCGISDRGRITFLQQTASNGQYSVITYQPDGTFNDHTPTQGIGSFTSQNPNCNNHGLIVGQVVIDGQTLAAVIDMPTKTIKTLPMLPESNQVTDYSYATAVNNQGIVVGCCSVNGQLQWVIWDALGKIHNLGLPPSYLGGFTTGINDQGMVIGVAGKATGSSAFIRLSDGRWINLSLYQGISASYPYGLNNQGQIIGSSDPPTEAGTHVPRPVIWKPIGQP